MTRSEAPSLITVPPAVLHICRVLRQGGYQAFVVGGGVRDALLSRPVHDWDVATDARPEVVRRLFARTVPTGIDFGTVTVIVDAQPVQVTTFRSEGGYRDARHPGWVSFGRRIEDDLMRRDLTVNALAYDPATGQLVDPYGGREDLAAGVIRTVGDPVERFQEDALRLLRAVRLATQLNFRLDDRTAAAVRQCGPNLAHVSRERVGEEWRRLLAAPAADRGLLLLHRTRLLGHVLVGTARPGRAEVLRTASALGRLRHADEQVKMTAVLVGLADDASDGAVLQGLVYPRATSRTIRHLARRFRAFDAAAVHDDPGLRRFLSGVGRDLASVFVQLWRAWQPLEPQRLGQGVDERTLRILEAGDPLSLSELAVDGHDLQGAGVPPGPQVGALLQHLLDHVLEHPEDNRRERLLALAHTRFRNRASRHGPEVTSC